MTWTTLILMAGLLVSLAGTCWAACSLHAQRWGRTAHAHDDLGAHEHPGGNRAHAHPLLRERYESAVNRVLGPPPANG